MKSVGTEIAIALTWDGARWPIRSLPPKVRVFLAGKARQSLARTSKTIAQLFTDDQVGEIRICWIPCLKGGAEVLSEPFLSMTGKRLAFRSIKTVQFGDILGVVYRRQK